jgi:hypothetical protein
MFSYGIVVVAAPRVRIDRYMTPLLPPPPSSTLYRHSQTFVLFQARWRTARRNYNPSLILFTETVILPLYTGSANNVPPSGLRLCSALKNTAVVLFLAHGCTFTNDTVISVYASLCSKVFMFIYTPHLKDLREMRSIAACILHIGPSLTL